MMVFLWFAVCSLLTGLLMGHIGRKKTVLLSADYGIAAAVTIYLLFIRVGIDGIRFIGIGNTILQVSLNPLLLDAVSKDKVTSMLTLGQFIKAISSTLGRQ